MKLQMRPVNNQVLKYWFKEIHEVRTMESVSYIIS